MARQREVPFLIREGIMFNKLLKWLKDPEITILSNDMLNDIERGRTAHFRYQSRVQKLAESLEGKQLTFRQILKILVDMKALPDSKMGEHRLGLLMDLGVPTSGGDSYQFINEGENEEGTMVFTFTIRHKRRYY